MAIKDVFKINRKTFFNPFGWFGYDIVKRDTKGVVNILTDVFRLPDENDTKPTQVLSFQEALKRYEVTPAGLSEIRKNYFLLAILFFILGWLALAADAYYILYIHRAIGEFFVGISVVALFLTQSFRYHFFYFQIHEQRLGCNFKDWWQFLLNQTRPSL